MERRRRRARVYLQMAICYKTWFGFLFYPVSFLLLLEKLSRFSYTSSLSRLLHVSSFLFLLAADGARYYLGTHGNVHRQVFHLTAFLFLSLCPLLPCVVYCNFVAEHRIAFDTIVGTIFVALLVWEVVLAMVVLHGLLRQETSRFVRLREATRERRKQDAFAAVQDGNFGHAFTPSAATS
uniref:Transmembrane protein n=1 Tax=Globisporangium ultimum (strain ATCC 200006 / CBS 805.95 / DAOM BR144) TaxID=431595 RepID=K3WSK9_GLOUD